EKPKRIIRSMPLAFDYPRDIVERATFRFPGGASIDGDAWSRRTSAFTVRFAPWERDRSVTLEYSLHAIRDSVPAAQVSTHLAAINDIEDDLGCTVTPSFQTSAQMRLIGPSALPAWLWFSAAALAIIGILLVTIWKLFVVRGRFLRQSRDA
ncbi:MAG TPA: hypothetical protein VLU46_02325, partial [Thermoanaerobaculia bacterium]|nr:hypothetical protein [Thermoanaerobaculia bacterium]